MYTAERAHLLAQCVLFVGLCLSLRRRGDYLHPFNLVCYLFVIQYLIPGILLVLRPESVFGDRWGILPQIMRVSGWAMLLVNVVVCMLALGFRRPLQVPLLRDGWEWNNVVLRPLSRTLLLLFICLMLYYAIIAEGAAQLTTAFRLQRGTGWINILVLISANLVPMVLWSADRRRSAVVCITLIFAFLMLSGGRLASIMALFWFLLFIYYSANKDWIRWLLVSGPILLPVSVYVVLRPHFDHVPISAVLAYNWRYLFLSEVGRLEQLSVYVSYSLQHGHFTFGETWVLSILGPFLSGTLDYIDYRNVISAQVFGLDPSTFRAGMGGSGIADLWINGGPGVLLIGPLFYVLVWRTLYDYMLRYGTSFATLLYINGSIVLFQAIQEMFTVGILYYTLAPLIAFSVICGLHSAPLSDKRKLGAEHIK